MREYGKVLSRFWVDFAHLSPEAKLVACYVFSCEHGNAVGLFRLPLTFVEEGTGLPSEGASKGLAEGLAERLWKYDEKSGYIYVPGAAEESYPKPLKGGDSKPDKRWTGLVSLLERLRRHPFYGDFSQRYSEHLAIPKGLVEPLTKALVRGFGEAPSEGAYEGQSKPLPKHKDGDGDIDVDVIPASRGSARVREVGAVESATLPDEPWLLVAKLYAERHDAETATTLSPGLHREHFAAIARAAGGDEQKIRDSLANFWADPWAREHGWPVGAWAKQFSRHLRGPEKRGSGYAPAVAEEFHDEGEIAL